MKNVLFVGPYLQDDGWGNAAREYIRALQEVNCALTVRPIFMNHQKEYRKFPEFDPFEQASEHYDVIIQNCLPNMFRKYGGVKNIGLSYFESVDIDATPWPRAMQTMVDQMWVCSEFEAKNLAKYNIPSVKILPIPTDLNKYKNVGEYKPFENIKHQFKFYFIGEYATRKNLTALIIAFHREFSISEPVQLVIKVNKTGLDQHTLLHAVNREIHDIKTNMKLHRNAVDYKTDIIISAYLPEEDLFKLHNSCDCFVMPSYGEAFCIPAFDAMMMGKTTIVNKNSSMAGYIKDGVNGHLVDSTKVPAISSDRPLSFLYTGQDCWYEINILDLQAKMRQAFEQNSPGYANRTVTNRELGMRYTHQYVGAMMEKLIYEV